MATTRKRNPRYVFPKGELVYPHVVKPDTKFVSTGVYQTEVKLPKDAELYNAKTGKSEGKIVDFLTQAIDDAVEQFGEEHNGKKRKGKTIKVTESSNPPFYVDDDEGILVVKAKLNAFVEPKNGDSFHQSPALFDAKGKPTRPSIVWNGSEGKLAIEAIPYFNQKDTEAGITLRLKALQITKLVTGGSADSGSFGFGEEEGFEDDGFDDEDNDDDDNNEGDDGFDDDDDDNDNEGDDFDDDDEADF